MPFFQTICRPGLQTRLSHNESLLHWNLIVDELVILIVPAIELTDLFAYLFRRVLTGQLTHGFEMYLTVR